ncbi:glutamate receptor ionotropic, delta-2-like [Periplaneta americana]|uniref:glutamate receptor ionotropic, delta-2-like n=1 Tax=Periplaneta americana TaxID=6978 RepID=UPI0037E7EC58
MVIMESIQPEDPISQYITVTLHDIHKQEIIPVTSLLIIKDKCIQRLSIAKSKLILFLGVSKEILLHLLQRTENFFSDWDSNTQLIIVIPQNFTYRDQMKENALVQSIFEEFWTRKRVLNVLIVTRQLNCNCDNNNMGNIDKVWIYNPFEFNANNKTRGNIYKFENGHSLLNEYIKKRTTNVYGYPLHVSMFEQYPTSIPVYNSETNSTMYKGMDGYVLSTVVQHFNFKPIIHKPSSENYYGTVLMNGTIEGSLGDVVYRRTEVSFNSRFVMSYGTNDIDFSIPIATDKMCIIAPKAKRIPKWKNMLVCYTTEVWLSVLLVYIACAICFYFFRKCHNWSKSPGCLPALEIFQIFVLSSVHHPPTVMFQRLLFASCLLFSLVLMNTFQGLLVTNITSPSYDPDINTLDQLEQSNLPIFTGSAFTVDLLKNGGYSISKNFKMYKGQKQEMLQHVVRAEAAITERESSIKFLVTKYVSPDGTKLMHMVAECPAYYYLAYILPKGDPYLPEFNLFFRKLMESGLIMKWYWDAIDIKIRLQNRSDLKRKTLKLFSLSDLQFAFYVLSVGLLLSTLLFVVEFAKAQKFVKLNNMRGKHGKIRDVCDHYEN